MRRMNAAGMRAAARGAVGWLSNLHEDTSSALAVAGFIVNALAIDLVIEGGLRFVVSQPARFDLAVVAVAMTGGAVSVSRYWRDMRRWSVVLVAAVVVGLLLLGTALYDTSFDSEGYQIPVIAALAHGWNPVAGPSGIREADLWPNGIWTLEAQLLHITGSPAPGKALDGLEALAALFLCAAAFRLLRRRPLACREMAALYLILLNPISIAELLSFLSDDDVYYLSLCLFAGLLLQGTEHRRLGFGVAASTIVLLVNAKMSGIYYAGLVGIAGWTLAPLVRGDRLRAALIGITAALVACLYVGWRPFVTDVIEHGGWIVTDPWQSERPANLRDALPPVQLLASLFGETGGTAFGAVDLKLPFLVEPDEVVAMGGSGPRVAGFGPLFALALVSAVAGTALLWRGIVRDPGGRFCLLVAAAFTAISAAFPEAWNARYVPLFWAVPPLLLLSWPRDGRAWVGRLGVVVMLLAASNSAVAFGGNLARLAYYSWRWRQLIAEMRVQTPIIVVPAPVDDGEWHFDVTLLERIRRAGIEARRGGNDECRHVIKSYHGVIICTAR